MPLKISNNEGDTTSRHLREIFITLVCDWRLSKWNLTFFFLPKCQVFSGQYSFRQNTFWTYFDEKKYKVKRILTEPTPKCHENKSFKQEIFSHSNMTLTSMSQSLIFFFFCKILQWTNFLIFKNMLIRLRFVVHFQVAGKDCLFIKTFQTYQSQNWWNANRSNNRTSATDRVSTAMLIQSFLKFLELENEAKIWRRHRHVEISTIQIQVFHLSF